MFSEPVFTKVVTLVTQIGMYTSRGPPKRRKKERLMPNSKQKLRSFGRHGWMATLVKVDAFSLLYDYNKEEILAQILWAYSTWRKRHGKHRVNATATSDLGDTFFIMRGAAFKQFLHGWRKESSRSLSSSAPFSL